MTHDVFISHSSKDKAIADAVCAALESAKIRCWISPRDAIPGKNYPGEIMEAIENSYIMVLIFSSNSNTSHHIIRELTLAVENDVIIIPFRIETVLPSKDMKYLINVPHWLDAMTPPLEQHLEKLAKTIRQFLNNKNETEERVTKLKEEQQKKQREKEEKDRQRREEPIALEPQREGEGIKITSLFDENGEPTRAVKKAMRKIEEKDRLLREEEKLRKSLEIPKTYTNSIGMKFTLIPAGEFMMGSELSNDEKPVHRVKISKPFYLGTYPVIQKEWKSVMGNNPSSFKGDNLPVERMSWNDVQEFIKRLNEKEGTDKYRLPSEAEWEYAARAGTTTNYLYESDLGDYAWFLRNSGYKTHEVGQKKPNPWGLYDMHGNVQEWLGDNWHDNFNGAPTDGSYWEGIGGSTHIARGGFWGSLEEHCRSTRRLKFDAFDNPENYRDALGFRLLRIL